MDTQIRAILCEAAETDAAQFLAEGGTPTTIGDWDAEAFALFRQRNGRLFEDCDFQPWDDAWEVYQARFTARCSPRWLELPVEALDELARLEERLTRLAQTLMGRLSRNERAALCAEHAEVERQFWAVTRPLNRALVGQQIASNTAAWAASSTRRRMNKCRGCGAVPFWRCNGGQDCVERYADAGQKPPPPHDAPPSFAWAPSAAALPR